MNFLQDEYTPDGLSQPSYVLAALQRAYGCRCNSAVFFLNSHCLRCDTPLGYEPQLGRVMSLVPESDSGMWRLAGPNAPAGQSALYRRCANLNTAAACNWLVEAGDELHAYCIACRLNRTVPDLTSRQDATLWGRIEAAKRRVISALVALRLPIR